MSHLVLPPLALLLAQTPSPDLDRGVTAPYQRLTNNFRDYTNFNLETVRGMDFADDGRLFAINTHGSTVLVHADSTPAPEGVWPTLNNPVSIDVFGDRLAVVGGATHALAIHDAMSGEILDVVALPREPGDVVVDRRTDGQYVAYVASQAENVVVAIDLDQAQEIARWPIPAERPRFLRLDTDPDTNVRRLLVSPMLSGNNTAPVPPVVAASATLALALGNVAGLEPIGGLPDEDLFAIAIDQAEPAVVPVARAAGTLLLEHARNPLTGEYWMLGVEARNDDLAQRSETELRGVFADNDLAIYSADTLSQPCTPFCATPDRIVDLDDADPTTAGPQYSSSTSLAFPYALAFVSEPDPYALKGWACVAASASDRIAFLDPSGNRVFQVDLPEGAIPRDVAIDPLFGVFLAVYCWGTNEILVFLIEDLTAPPLHLELGLDPADDHLRSGRRTWYDAGPSLDGRTTCNHCHADGGMDLLGWKLSDVPADHKDVMVTQSLRSILDTPAYHWREERLLPDFNAAFPGLLGHAGELDEAELADFVEFVFSLQAHANPVQSAERVLDDRRTSAPFRNGLAGSAVRGQRIFSTVPVVGPLTCAQCHMLPNGTQGHDQPDAASIVPSAVNMGVAHLRQLAHKDQELVTVAALGIQLPRTGFGLLHNGTIADLFAFVSAFPLAPQQASDVTAFIEQFDQGIAPAAHAVLLLDERDTSAVAARIQELLLSQAHRRWIDVVAHGRTTLEEGTELSLRWLYDRSTRRFVPHLSGVPEMTLQAFADLSERGLASNVFLGLPWGDGRRWALDPDDDDLRDDEEAAQGTDPRDGDSDDDGFPDGYELAHGTDPLAPNATVPDTTPPAALPGFPRLDHATAGYAKFFLETDEPVTLVVTAGVSGGPAQSTTTVAPRRRQTVVLQDLDPSTEGGLQNRYVASVRMLDLSGNSRTVPLEFNTRTSVTVPGQVLVGDMQWISTAPQGPALDAKAEIRVVTEANAPFSAPVPGMVALLQLLYRVAPADPWSIAASVQSPVRVDGFEVRSVTPEGEVVEAYQPLPGPFLVAPLTDGDGRAQVEFSFPGPVPAPAAGQIEVRLGVLAVLVPSPGYDPLAPVFESGSLPLWKLPSTDPELRGIEFSY